MSNNTLMSNIRYLKPFRLGRRFASGHPLLYFPLAKLLGNKQIITSATEIVMDGFPRCGNSLAEAALRLSQEPTKLALATHAHAPAQVKASVGRGIPTVVLIRDPDEAVASYYQMVDGAISIAALYKDYYAYYSHIIPLLGGVALMDYSQVVKDASLIPSVLNAKFGMSLRVPVIDRQFREELLGIRDRTSRERIGRVPIYSGQNNKAVLELRERRRREAEGQAKSFRHNDKLAARTIYNRLLVLNA